MVEQRHDPEECNEAGEDDAPDSQLWCRKEERGNELQYAHHPIKLARMPPRPKPRTNISRSRQINYCGNRKDCSQGVGENVRKPVCPHHRLLSNRDREITQDIGFHLEFLEAVFHNITKAYDALER